MIKQYFLWAMALIIPLAFAVWFLFLLLKTFQGMFHDWKLGRELDELQASAQSREQQRNEANAERLNNGCDHDFSTGAHGLPPDVCRLCGMQRQKPTGACDHEWKVLPDPIPSSACVKCGRKYSVTEQLA